MRWMKPIAVTTLSFAFLAAGAFAQNSQTSQSKTQSTTTTNAYGDTQTTTHHRARKSQSTTMPDGTTVTSQQKTDSRRYNANGNQIAGERTTTSSQDTVSPDGMSSTHVETKTHTQSNAQPQPQPQR